ncbi:hypothetical protein L1994_11770 [Methanomicrobium antiquum]|uniref:Uncharacterized protein n=1 Tax=Methanomicrobium antiquum TaxID=487686 RepID=A0AAF0FRP5_9EURY|nr:hypothetical protein [Methanomicrobium antiquum]WFN36796.1 hypothetical protein L1994_11770 [Methanomicrobium antiquum]
MADFIETTSTKSAVRLIENPIADIASFDAIISQIMSENPFECVDYVAGGETIDGVTINRQYYTAKIIYEDDDAKTVGTISVKAPSVDAFSEASETVMANTELAADIGGDPVRDLSSDGFYCQLKCHDVSGEIYYVTFTRSKVRISSYEDDAVRLKVETWADTVSALA